MAFALNPPSTPIVNARGMIDPAWYRFFASIQRLVGGDLLQRIQDAPYITSGASDVLGNERLLEPGDGIKVEFAPGAATVALDEVDLAPGPHGSASQTIRVTFDQYGRASAVEEFDLDTDNITEGASNLFFTEARARASLSAGDGIDYDDTTGVISALSAGAAPVFTPYTAPVISNPPTQAEVQDIADAVGAISTALTDLITLLQANGNLT